MSIFSRLRRRGDDGSAAESPPNTPPSAPAPKAPPAVARAHSSPRARGAQVAAAHAGSDAAPPSRERPRPPAASPPRGNVQAPVAGAIATPAAAVPSRSTVRGLRPQARRPRAPGAPAPVARAPVAVAGPTGGSLDLVIERGPREQQRSPGRGDRGGGAERAAAATGPRRVQRLRRRRPARDVRGAGGRARHADPQRDDGGALRRGAGQLARARAPGAEVAALDGVGGRPRRRWSRRWTASWARCRRRWSRASPRS